MPKYNIFWLFSKKTVIFFGENNFLMLSSEAFGNYPAEPAIQARSAPPEVFVLQQPGRA